MNIEPIAWTDEINTFVLNKDYKQFSKNLQNGMIPLYTHPAEKLNEQFKKGFEAGKEEGWKAHKFHHPAKILKQIKGINYWVDAEPKTLTDEEIEEVAKPYCDLQNWVVDKHEFARAILRKAQDK